MQNVKRYLRGEDEMVMKMKPSSVFKVVAHIDASFSSHPDGKSQSGVKIKVGGISVYFGSRNQKCSRSPTEAELVA
jgi:hypothetical protein